MSSTSTEAASEPTRRTIASFAMIVGAALLVVAAFQWRRGAPQWVWVTLISVVAAFLVCAAVAPLLLRPVYRGWMWIGEILGWVNTRVILTLVFFLVVTPIGLLMRLFGRSPMAASQRDSYWNDVEPHSYRDRHVEKQF